MPLRNDAMRERHFLAPMYADSYFPDHCVDDVKAVLVRLCERIEGEAPADLEALYALTHAATEDINALQDRFGEAGSEIETGARELIARELDAIATAYGFEADVEELIAPRDW